MVDRKEMIEKIVDCDSKDIVEGDLWFLLEILTEGFKGYNKYTDEELRREYDKLSSENGDRF